MEFYAPNTQRIVGPVVMLPQEGSASGGTNRPLNSFAILRPGYSILLDAAYSWCLAGIRRLAEEGHPPQALVLSHRNTAGSGDAFAELRSEFDIPVLLHPDDQRHEEARDAGPYADPVGDPALEEAGVRMIHMPGHTDGSIMLHVEDEGGILLAGDSAVAPGPEQDAEPPRLERPVMPGAAEDRFIAEWQEIWAYAQPDAILPLHGHCYLKRDLGDDAYRAAVENIWTGPPMDPRG
ncbi:MBL fold metallo-hydrolase [Pontivivens ytuae]|uniref:MBL fold metallo-hydrolase n=1 Tax=Pontivivens ytuae TaxID=2789856 RepID=A0A7S9LV99_9RHOB|nr:MBL fold metallo-hydrolase [Pontivivens ytuae]QPH55967.1 MBL fold metallo-hydrolase [Pontivivens ytuae]